MSSGFPMVALKEIVEPAERPEAVIAGKLYRQIGVRLWGGGAYERESVDGSQTKYQTLSRVEVDDIIVNKIWARNGSVAVVTKALAGCYGSGEFPTFSPDHTKLEPRWFHWLTKTKGFWEQCDEKSQGTSGKNRIRPEQFLKVTIPLPPLEEQRRIVAHIEELAAKVEEARGLRRETVEELRRLTPSVVAQTLADCLDDAKVVTVEDVARSVTDGDHLPPPKSYSGEVPFIFISNIVEGKLNFSNCKWISQQYFDSLASSRVAKKGDVLYTAVGSYGIPCLVDTDESFCFQRHIAIIKPDQNLILSKYLIWALSSSDVLDQATKAATGSAQLTVPLRDIRKLRFLLPPMSEQRRMVAYLDDLQARVDSVKRLQAETRTELDTLLPSVLDKAFRGELV